MQAQDAIPSGYCQCGCGQRTALNSQDRPARGIKKGEPSRFVSGHNGRKTLASRITVDHDSGCWIWTGETGNVGYGIVTHWEGNRRTGRTVAHRVVFEAHRGPIPENAQLDHLCRNRICVNPDHLEPVTQKENIRRGSLTKLTQDEVREIRASSDDYHTLAARYEITPQYVGQLKRHDARLEDRGLPDSYCPTKRSTQLR